MVETKSAENKAKKEVKAKTTKAAPKAEVKAEAKSAPKKVSKAINRVIHTSAQKLNLVGASIRGLTAARALNVLTFSKKRVSLDVKKTVMSAMANAEHNYGMDIDKLVVDEVYTGRAFGLKRFMARGRGRSTRIEKRYANLTVILREEA
jgi:large subunit ribosomal protein L22